MREERDGPRPLRGCQFCGLVDEINGCHHMRPATVVDGIVSVTGRLVPGGTLAVETTPFAIPISSATGLPIVHRW
jgi:hypothetical protein